MDQCVIYSTVGKLQAPNWAAYLEPIVPYSSSFLRSTLSSNCWNDTPTTKSVKRDIQPLASMSRQLVASHFSRIPDSPSDD